MGGEAERHFLVAIILFSLKDGKVLSIYVDKKQVVGKVCRCQGGER